MYKKIDFSKLGGFPGTQDTLDFLQKSYSDAIAGMAKAFGNDVIVSGCEVTGSHVSDGWIVHDGELLPFEGGSFPPGATFIVVEDNEKLMFDDGQEHTVLFSKVAKIGSDGVSDTDWADLVRLEDVKSISQKIEGIESGIFLPVYSDLDGISSISGSYGYFTKIGDIVDLNIDNTLHGIKNSNNCYFKMTSPILHDFITVNQLKGVVSFRDNVTYGRVFINVASNSIEFHLNKKGNYNQVTNLQAQLKYAVKDIS